MAKRHHVTAWRITWRDKEIAAEIEAHIKPIFSQVMLDAEREAKASLMPGRGVDSGTMKKRTHVAQGGHDWDSEHIDPIPGGGSDLGGQLVEPNKVPTGRAYGRLVLELGCGQKYAVYFHQRVFPFLRQAWQRANARLPQEIEANPL